MVTLMLLYYTDHTSAFETYISLLPGLIIPQLDQRLLIVVVAGVTVLQKSHRAFCSKCILKDSTKFSLRSLPMHCVHINMKCVTCCYQRLCVR